MQTAILQPIQQKERTAIVDILRGWALLGVVLMNYADHYYLGLDFSSFKPGLSTNIMMIAGNILFAAKSWTMLSFLFGYGFTVLLKNLKAKEIATTPFFLRRMFWLLVLAVINSAFYFGDILKDYAVMGMILLLLINFKPKTTFIISLILIFVAPAIGAYIGRLGLIGGLDLMKGDLHLFQSNNPFKVLWFGLVGTYKYEFLSPQYLVTVHFTMMGCFLLGVTAQKIDFFNRLKDLKKNVKWVFWLSLVLALLLVGLFFLTNVKKWTWMKYYGIQSIFVLTEMIFFMSALCWLYIAGKLKRFFRSMQVIGRMTLTNYMTQNVIALLLFSGFGFGLAITGRIHFGYYLLFAFIIYVIQVYFSKWWLKKYKYGPVEWIWRQLSYGKRLPIRRAEEPEPVDEIGLQPIPVIESSSNKI
jgi:uncharacterized protein